MGKAPIGDVEVGIEFPWCKGGAARTFAMESKVQVRGTRDSVRMETSKFPALDWGG